MNKINNWLRARRNDDDALGQFLKFMFTLGQKSWLHAIISAVSGILIPIFYDNENYVMFWVGIIILVFDIIYAYVCNSYQISSYTYRKYAAEILSSQSSLLKSVVIEMENNNNWKSKIFKTVSDLVCEKIYTNFKEVFHCETRVAIEYIFDKNINSSPKTKCVKMSGRRSSKRATVKKSMALEKRKDYYSYKIFINNNHGINILDESKIKDKTIWYKNPHNSVDVKKYVGIAVSVYEENKVKFILEIDFIDDFDFGEENSDDEIKSFINQYLMTYINIVSMAYLLNLNKQKEIPEV